MYFSRGSFGSGFDVAICPEAVAIAASETSKIDTRLADTVKNFIRCEVVGTLKRKARAIPDFRFVIPIRCAGALPYSTTTILSRIISDELVTRLDPEIRPAHALAIYSSRLALSRRGHMPARGQNAGATTRLRPGTWRRTRPRRQLRSWRGCRSRSSSSCCR